METRPVIEVRFQTIEIRCDRGLVVKREQLYASHMDSCIEQQCVTKLSDFTQNKTLRKNNEKV